MMMDFLVQAEEKVKYACSCGCLKPIVKMYFCRHCQKIRCGYCVSHEVDLHYCGNCSENLPSTEARLKKNRCTYCYNCPSCQNILNVRAVSCTIPHPEDSTKTVSKKFYYLACGFCRWTSREAGLPDQSTASGGWPERECPHSKRVAELVEHYQEVALFEKLEEDEIKRKKFQSRPYNFSLSERFGLGAAVVRKRLSTSPREPRQPQTHVQPACAVEQVPPLSEDLFTTPTDLTTLTTLRQRYMATEMQPVDVAELYPFHKNLLSKRSLRCRECEHNVSKPEFNPSSTKFKIQLSAFYHVPDVRFLTCEPIYPGKESELIITVCNPTQHITSMQFLQSGHITPEPSGQVTKQEACPEEGEEISSLASALTHHVVLSESLRYKQFYVNGTIKLPENDIQLLPRDDAAEYDDTSKAPTFNDDPKLVVWRKGNKVALRLHVKPDDDAKGQLGVTFRLEYSYINTMTTLEKKEPQKLQLECQIFLNAGTIFAGSE